MFRKSDRAIWKDGRKLCKFTLRVFKYRDSDDSLRFTIRVAGTLRHAWVSASAYRDDEGLAAALIRTSRGKAELYAPISVIRDALDALAFPS
jgi:hypothetical protein